MLIPSLDNSSSDTNFPSVINDYHHYKIASLTSAVSEAIKVDNIPLTPTQQQQVFPSNSVVRLLEWISRRIEENKGHIYELIFPQVKKIA